MDTNWNCRLLPIGMPTICWKTFPAKTRKMLSARNSLDDAFFLVFAIRNRVFLYKEGFFVILNQRFVSTILIFVNEGVSHDSCEPVLQFPVGNGCLKGRKINGLGLFIRLKVEDLRCSNNSFEFRRIHVRFIPLLE